MNKLLTIVYIWVLCSFSSERNSPGCAQMDILLVGDFSSSVIHHENFIVKACQAFINQFELSERGIKMGIIRFNEQPELLSPLTSNRDQLNSALQKMYRTASGSTNIDSALMAASDEIFSNRKRNGINKIIILISDGDPDSGEVYKMGSVLRAKKLHDQGVSICSILVLAYKYDRDYMKMISNGCYSEAHYQTLAEELKKLDLCL